MPQYLIKQRQGWYAVLEVPRAVRAKIGKARFKETLQTDSLKVAEVRKHAFIAKWKAQIEVAKNNGDLKDVLYVMMQKKEDALRKGLKPSLSPEAIQYLTAINVPDGKISDKEMDELRGIQNKTIFPLDRSISDYEKSLTYLETKTQDQQVSDLRRFVKKFPTAQSATNRAIRDWVEINLITEQQLSVRTCRRIMTACRGFWKFLQDRKSLDLPSPFEGVVPQENRVKTQKQIASDQRRSFSPDDYRKLLKAAQEAGDTDLVNLIKLGAYTGCRREELCSLKVDNVKKDRIQIEDAKTQAGWREVPLHDSIIDLVATMKDESKDGYLFSGLANGNKHKKRGDAIGKRFTRLKTSLGYGRNHVFHSFRKGFVTLFESIGPEAEVVLARTIGHKITTMSYGLYSSGGTTFETKRVYINKIRWENDG